MYDLANHRTYRNEHFFSWQLDRRKMFKLLT